MSEVQVPDHGQMQDDIKTFMSQKEALMLHTTRIHVTNEIERLAATEFLSSTLIPLRNTIEAKRKTFSLKLRQIATAWDAEFKPAIEAVDGLIAFVKQVLLEYQLDLERIQRETQAELDRQAEIERKAAAGRKEENQIPEEIGLVAPRPETTIRTASGTSTMRKVPVVVVVDENLIPRKYLMIDHHRLDPDIKAGIEVQGAKLEYRNELAIRTK